MAFWLVRPFPGIVVAPVESFAFSWFAAFLAGVTVFGIFTIVSPRSAQQP
jgi:hypothetical protein